jgi:hypothetical protein
VIIVCLKVGRISEILKDSEFARLSTLENKEMSEEIWFFSQFALPLHAEIIILRKQ